MGKKSALRAVESSAALNNTQLKKTPLYVVGVGPVAGNDNNELRGEQTAPLYQSYPQEAVDGVREHLRRWGVCGTRRLLREYDLEVLADAIADVEAAIRAGEQSRQWVTNPAGLFLWTLKEAVDNASVPR